MLLRFKYLTSYKKFVNAFKNVIPRRKKESLYLIDIKTNKENETYYINYTKQSDI